MTENMKKFLELASQEDRDYIEKLTRADKAGAMALAAEKGIALTDADFAKPDSEGELSLDEADAVAGGENCTCLFAGTGSPLEQDSDECWCAMIGNGYKHGTDYCWCEVAGYGDSEGIDRWIDQYK